MDNFEWSHDLDPQSPLYKTAESASAILRSMVRPAADHFVRAHWTAGSDGKLDLLLHDAYARVSASFRPDQLTGDWRWFALDRAYRELLREASRLLVGAAITHAGLPDE